MIRATIKFVLVLALMGPLLVYGFDRARRVAILREPLGHEPSPETCLLFPGTRYPTGDVPLAVAIADFNGDGANDFAVANAYSNDVSVLLNLGNRTFAAERRFRTGEMPVSVAVGDFDKNGTQDFVVANRSSSDVSVLLGFGNGDFAPEQRFGTGRSPQSVVVADLDHDGAQDLAVANLITSDVSVVRHTVTGRKLPSPKPERIG